MLSPLSRVADAPQGRFLQSERTMSFNTQFLANPIHFMRTWAMLPPDGSPVGQLIKKWAVAASNFKDGVQDRRENGKNVVDLEYRDGGQRIQFATVAKHSLFPQALTISLSPLRTSEDQIPTHWLPWGKEKVVTTSIPAVPRNLVEPDEDENPRFFFTAGINGCSVFVKGPATNPTLFHSGTQGTLKRDASEFWLEQVDTATSGKAFDTSIFSDVDKSQYMNRQSPAVKDFIKWAQGEGRGGNSFTVELVNNFGCVFGMRFGHHWSFYLQEAGLISTARFVKRGDVQVTKVGGVKKYSEKGTGFEVQKQTLVHDRHLGKLKLPGKKERIYAAVNQKCVPFRLSEIFPNRMWAGQITDLMVRHTM